MDLDLARRLAGKLTFGEPLTLQETLLLRVGSDFGLAFLELLDLSHPTLDFLTQFRQRYYVEPVPETHDLLHFERSFELFAKLQDVEMGAYLFNNADRLRIYPAWTALLSAVAAYAPAPLMVLLLAHIRRRVPSDIYDSYLNSILRLILQRNDMNRFRELVELLPYDAKDWQTYARLKIQDGQLKAARVALTKLVLHTSEHDRMAGSLLLKEAFHHYPFRLEYLEQVRVMLEEVGYEIYYRYLIRDALADAMNYISGAEELLRYYLTHDPQAGQNESVYLELCDQGWGSQQRKQELRELIHNEIERLQPQV